MKQRIVERHKIGKGKYVYNSYKGFLDYFGTNCLVGFIALPFVLVFLMFKYTFVGFAWCCKKIYHSVKKDNKNE